jgi:pimeloyl-ACP methyl ester carboxylesterase
MRAMSLENHYGALHKITVETRVLCGELDRTCPAWHSERLGRDIARAQVDWLPGKGHMLSFEAPDAVLGAITGS